MLYARLSPEQKRRNLRERIAGGRLLRFPGAFSPLVARLLEDQGWDGVYVSGAVVAADLGLPDIGLTTLSEVAARGQQIARVTDLPALVDADTGFGEPMNVARTVQELEDRGLAGCHLEDQENPKRCGHLEHKTVVPTQVMTRRIQAAAGARRDENFLLVARTDARAVEGLGAAVRRAAAYLDAGADAIFPEALETADEFAAFRDAVDAPLLANMTEFGRSPCWTPPTSRGSATRWSSTRSRRCAWRWAPSRRGLERLRDEGTQASLVAGMQTRARLYEVLDYASYNAYDRDIYNFSLEDGNRGDPQEGS